MARVLNRSCGHLVGTGRSSINIQQDLFQKHRRHTGKRLYMVTVVSLKKRNSKTSLQYSLQERSCQLFNSEFRPGSLEMYICKGNGLLIQYPLGVVLTSNRKYKNNLKCNNHQGSRIVFLHSVLQTRKESKFLQVNRGTNSAFLPLYLKEHQVTPRSDSYQENPHFRLALLIKL